MSFLEVESIGRRIAGNWIVSNISFHQTRLQNIAIAGETGSGKSTLLKMIAGLTQPDTGQINFEGVRIEGPAEKLIPGHPGIAYLSQVFELPKFLRVEQVLQYASKIPADDAQNLFEICRINHLLKRRTDELSGGEQQRIALARLLVMRPKLLLLDEPFSNLDLIHKTILKTVLQDAQAQLQLSYILTSHDPQDTLTWADTMGIMQRGEIIQWGEPEEVYRQPGNVYTAGLLGKYVVLDHQMIALAPNQPIQNGDKWIARPEAFKTTKATDNRGNTQVKAIRFAGPYYELDVQMSNRLLTVYTYDKSWTPGDKVRLSLSPADVWQLKD